MPIRLTHASPQQLEQEPPPPPAQRKKLEDEVVRARTAGLGSLCGGLGRRNPQHELTLTPSTHPQKKLQVKVDEKRAYHKVKGLEVGKQMAKLEGLEADVRLAEGAVQVCMPAGRPFLVWLTD